VRVEVKKYRFLHHTADAKFQAFGETLEEAFQQAALALVSLMWDWEKVGNDFKVPVQVEGHDMKQLLVNYLEEILYLFDTKRFLLSQVDDLTIRQKQGHYVLQALFKGDEYSNETEIFGEVKAITYNEMEITETVPFVIQVVADI
jgi:SHS2 domain-containing protein